LATIRADGKLVRIIRIDHADERVTLNQISGPETFDLAAGPLHWLQSDALVKRLDLMILDFFTGARVSDFLTLQNAKDDIDSTVEIESRAGARAYVVVMPDDEDLKSIEGTVYRVPNLDRKYDAQLERATFTTEEPMVAYYLLRSRVRHLLRGVLAKERPREVLDLAEVTRRRESNLRRRPQ